MYLVADEKGFSAILVKPPRSSMSSISRTQVSRAASVESPAYPPLALRVALLQRNMIRLKCLSSLPGTASPIPNANVLFGVTIRRTEMRFCVSVPVLSVQITVVLPRVSTLSKFLMRAFFFDIRLLAIVSDSVTVGNNPSGTFATMIPMAKTNELIAPFPVAMLIMKKTTPRNIAMVEMMVMNRCNSFLMGVVTLSASFVS
mmetsp:Transcript_10209/g.20412  ORF Transcript_10209/g.20412 Transcript_10209/m.20412 type:complete len:201 (+) Transcript_10209:494-1096(+)